MKQDAAEREATKDAGKDSLETQLADICMFCYIIGNLQLKKVYRESICSYIKLRIKCETRLIPGYCVSYSDQLK